MDDGNAQGKPVAYSFKMTKGFIDTDTGKVWLGEGGVYKEQFQFVS